MAKKPQLGDGGFTNPRVFNTIEEAEATITAEQQSLENQDLGDVEDDNATI